MRYGHCLFLLLISFLARPLLKTVLIDHDTEGYIEDLHFHGCPLFDGGTSPLSFPSPAPPQGIQPDRSQQIFVNMRKYYSPYANKD